MGWVMARVYMSSTIADLGRERRAVMEWLVAAQHQVVHSYRPDSDTVRESSLEDVDTGSEHRDTLAARAHLASWTGEAGDPAARDQFAALLPI